VPALLRRTLTQSALKNLLPSNTGGPACVEGRAADVAIHFHLAKDQPMTTTRIGLTAALLSLSLAFAPAAFAQDKMGKDDGMKKDTMSKDAMKKDDGGGMMKKDDGMKKDGGMMKKDDGMMKKN
jgi:pentapeptide MXKDX repeat protein